MKYREISCSSILKKITRPDDLFDGVFTIDPYQNCSFGCVYCDSTFEDIIYIKTNIATQLKHELQPLSKGRIIIGSVHDPYQEIEKTYHLTHAILELLKDYDYPIHILTKSLHVIEDLSILKEFNDVMISFSLLTLNSQLARNIELHTPSPNERLKVMNAIHDQGIKTGIAFIPIIPFISDLELESMIKSAKKYHADYLLYKHLELKGDQKRIFFNFIQNNFHNLLEDYEILYQDNYLPKETYQEYINGTIEQLCMKYNLKTSVKMKKS